MFLFFSNISNASAPRMPADNYASQLLKVVKWDEEFEKSRKIDIEYLFGTISGDKVKDLTQEQRTQVILSIRNAMLKQIIADKDIFKNELIKQYNQFFTRDEFDKLIMYYNTQMMQKLIQAKLDNKSISTEDLIKETSIVSEEDKRAMDSYRDSYLIARFSRFQEKVNPIINKMIADRIEKIYSAVMAKLPELIAKVQSIKIESHD
jgi:hypothetical protein